MARRRRGWRWLRGVVVRTGRVRPQADGGVRRECGVHGVARVVRAPLIRQSGAGVGGGVRGGAGGGGADALRPARGDGAGVVLRAHEAQGALCGGALGAGDRRRLGRGLAPFQWTVYGLGVMRLAGSSSRSGWGTGNPVLGDDGAGYTILRCTRRSPFVLGDGPGTGCGRATRIRALRRSSPPWRCRNNPPPSPSTAPRPIGGSVHRKRTRCTGSPGQSDV